MAQHGLRIGKRYRFVIEGFVWSESSNLISLCDEPPVATPRQEEDGATYSVGPVGQTWTLPSTVVVDRPEPIADYPPGTLFEYGTEHGSKILLVYDPTQELPWEIANSKGRRRADENIDRRYLVRLYRERET